MKFVVYERMMRSSRHIGTYARRRDAVDTVRQLESCDILDDTYEPQTYYIEERCDETCTMQEL